MQQLKHAPAFITCSEPGEITQTKATQSSLSSGSVPSLFYLNINTYGGPPVTLMSFSYLDAQLRGSVVHRPGWGDNRNTAPVSRVLTQMTAQQLLECDTLSKINK